MIKPWRKYHYILFNLLNIFIQLPLRIKRCFIHFGWFFINDKNDIPQLKIISGFFEWLVFLPFLIIDLLGIPQILNILQECVFWNIRSLNQQEIRKVYPIFKNAIPYQMIRINEHEFFFAKNLKIAFVNFNHINTYGPISSRLLVHELVHIWQYHQLGSIYIIKAMIAQRSKAGYNYGGRELLINNAGDRHALLNFNFEQQGDVVEDFYQLSVGKAPSWIDLNDANKKYFYPYMKSLQAFRQFEFKGSDKEDIV